MSRGRLDFVTRRPVAITMFVLAMAVFGVVSLAKLPVDLLPEISYPTLTVRTTWPGAAPEDVEQRVSERVQEALATLDDLVRSTSISRAGVSDVVLDFDWGTPMTFAVQDVREKLDSVFLPRDAERPLILRYDPNLDPVLRIGVRLPAEAELDLAAAGGDVLPEAERTRRLIHLRWVAEKRIERELATIEGVAAAQVRGGLEEEIRVLVNPHALAAKSIDPLELGTRLAQENINASGGSLLEGSTEYLVRTLNEFQSVDEIAELPVARRGEAVVRVRDVGEVVPTYAEREVVSRIGGGEAVEVAVYREAGANIVDVARRVRERVFGTEEQRRYTAGLAARGEERGGAPSGASFEEREKVDYLAWQLRRDAELELLSDQSTFIQQAVDEVKDAAIVGALLATLVIWVFLRRLPPTLIIAVSIPVSVVVTFAPMFMAGVSLNVMSLGGLALGVGMLVDNSIVVLESITRCRDEGDDLARAAVRGVSEVAGAVTASTLTTIAVFAPIVFVGGIAGQMFGDQALTVVTSLAVSLVVAVLLIPMLASRPFLDAGGRRRAPGPAVRPPRLLAGTRWNLGALVPSLLVVTGRAVLAAAGLVLRYVVGGAALLGKRAGAVLLRPLDRAFGAAWSGLERGYPRALRAALRRPPAVIAVAAVLLAIAIARAPALGVELVPEVHQGEFTAFVKLEVGTPLATTDEVLARLDRDVRRLPGVESTALTVGVERDALTREVEGPHTGRLTVRLDAASSTPEREEEIVAAVRALLVADPAARTVEITRPTPFTLDAPVAVEVRGHDLERLAAVAREVERRVRAVPGLADVRTTLRAGHPEALVRFDRDKTLEYGLDLARVSDMVRDQVLGSVTTRFHRGDDRIDVRVMGDEAVLASLEDVLEMPVNPGAENPVPLRAVASVRTVQGPAEIRRIGNTRAVVVSASATSLDLGGTSRRIEAALADMEVPDDVTVALGGQKREMDDAQRQMRFALLLAVFLVYVVMAIQFESLVQPLVILLTVPLAAVGVVLALDALAVPLSVVVFIGLIMLAGIVVNNAIVLVDRINQKRAEGMPVDEAIVEAGRARLRPILMTTATTVLGLLPLTGWLEGLPVIGAFGAGAGTELRGPMAITVVAGLVSSTLLTLIVVPVAYALVARPGERRRRGREAAGATA